MENRLPIDDERLSAYLDDELSPQERADIEKLTASNADYRNALEELMSVRGAMRGLPESKLPDTFTDRVMADVSSTAGTITHDPRNKRSEKLSETHPYRKIAWAVAALAAVILAMLTIPSLLDVQGNVALNDAKSPKTKSSAVASSVDGESFDAINKPPNAKQEAAGLDSISAMDSEPMSEPAVSSKDSLRNFRAPLLDEKMQEADDDSELDKRMNSVPMSAIVERESRRGDRVDDNLAANELGEELEKQRRFSFSCDAVAEVRLKDSSSVNQFFETLSTNRFQVDPNASAVTRSLPTNSGSAGYGGTTEWRGGLGTKSAIRSEDDEDRDDSLAKSKGQRQPSGRWLGAPENATPSPQETSEATTGWSVQQTNEQVVVLEADANDLLRLVNDLKQQSIDFNFVAVNDNAIQVPSQIELELREQVSTKEAVDGAEQVEQSAGKVEVRAEQQTGKFVQQLELTNSQADSLRRQIAAQQTNSTRKQAAVPSVESWGKFRDQSQFVQQLQQIGDERAKNQTTGRRCRVLVNVIPPDSQTPQK